ncbi:hypothetical protein SDC9_152545 [bioreactor metagenome]|uniref:Uncharacterized protein n=1 Tax=bioreactor metagenome TaxID=1076179 RepID=A0A645ETE1_9ZZZZ
MGCVGIFQRVMQQACADGICIHLELDEYLSYCQGVDDVRFPARTFLVLMLARRESGCCQDLFLVGFGVLEGFLDEPFDQLLVHARTPHKTRSRNARSRTLATSSNRWAFSKSATSLACL